MAEGYSEQQVASSFRISKTEQGEIGDTGNDQKPARLGVEVTF